MWAFEPRMTMPGLNLWDPKNAHMLCWMFARMKLPVWLLGFTGSLWWNPEMRIITGPLGTTQPQPQDLELFFFFVSAEVIQEETKSGVKIKETVLGLWTFAVAYWEDVCQWENFWIQPQLCMHKKMPHIDWHFNRRQKGYLGNKKSIKWAHRSQSHLSTLHINPLSVSQQALLKGQLFLQTPLYNLLYHAC